MWAQLLITGLLVALLPLSVVWASKDVSKYRKLIAVTLFLTFDLIVFGAFTRLTDSGLGCPDWPGCYGEANPFQSHEAIKTAQDLMPTGPVTLLKAWVEMIHRYLAMSVGVLIVAQMLIAWWQRRKLQHSPWLPTALFFCVGVQGAFGAWTVTMKLQPIIVTIHLLLGMILLALLAWSFARELTSSPNSSNGLKPEQSGLIRIATIALILLGVQIALGGWVSTNYAALACNDYPLCNGVFAPEMDFVHGFTLWRKLGQQANGDYLPFSALVAIQWVHRSFAWCAIGAVVWAAFLARKTPTLSSLANKILLVIFAQLVTGVATVFFSWPLLIAVLHNAGAALLVLLLTMLNYRARHAA
ncbi:MAG: COX15/CtaA family protein [Pseudomonadota bacterium]